MVGKMFPAFNLPLLIDRNEPIPATSINLEQLILRFQKQGEQRPWLLNVWASWCPQCYHEHQFITSLADAGAIVVGLNYKDETENGLGFLNKMGNPYDIILADQEGALGFDLGVSGAPETFLIDPKGRILVRHAGVIDREVWQQKFASHWQTVTTKPLFEEPLRSSAL